MSRPASPPRENRPQTALPWGLSQPAVDYFLMQFEHHAALLPADNQRPQQAIRRLSFNTRPKYSWAKPADTATLFHPQGIANAANGVLWVLNGEKSTIVHWQAGYHASANIFGEINLSGKKALIEQAILHSVQQIIVPLDNDEAGYRAGEQWARFADYLAQNHITLTLLDLGAYCESLHITDTAAWDTRDLWLYVAQQDTESYHAHISALQNFVYTPPEVEPYDPAEEKPTASNTGEINPVLMQTVIDALYQNAQKPKLNGIWLNGCSCPNPNHHDKNSSFGFNVKDGTGNCFVCAGMNLKTICGYLGIDWRAIGFYVDSKPSRRKRKKSKDRAKQSKPIETPNPYTDLLAYVQQHPKLKLQKIHKAYLSPQDIPNGARYVAVISGLGSNKSGTANILLDQAESALYVSPYERLVEKHVQRFNAEAQKPMAFYKHVPLHNHRHERKFASCYPSLQHLRFSNGSYPQYQTVVIDEVAQVLRQAVSSIPENATASLQAFQTITQEAQQTLFIDGTMTPATLNFLAETLGEVTVIINTHQNTPLPAYGVDNESDIIGTAIQLHKRGKKFAIVCDSKKTLKRLYTKIVEETDANILMLTGDNITHQDIAPIAYDLNQAVEDHDALLISPVLASGVDITAPVDTVMGVFKHGSPGKIGLLADDMLQMLGRFRHKNQVVVLSNQHIERENPTDAEHIAQHITQNLYQLAQYPSYRTLAKTLTLDSNADGSPRLSDIQQALVRLTAALMAETHQQTNQPHYQLWARLRQWYKFEQGYKLSTDFSEDLDAIRKQLQAEEKAAIVAAPPILPEEYQKLADSQQTTETLRYGAAHASIAGAYHLAPDTPLPDTSQVIDHWQTWGNQAVQNYVDVFHSDAYQLQFQDIMPLVEGNPHRLQRQFQRVQLVQQIILKVWGSLENFHPDHRFTLLEMAGITELWEAHDANRLFNRKADRHNTDRAILHYVLRWMGLQLTYYKQRNPKPNEWALKSVIFENMQTLATAKQSRFSLKQYVQDWQSVPEPTPEPPPEPPPAKGDGVTTTEVCCSQNSDQGFVSSSPSPKFGNRLQRQKCPAEEDFVTNSLVTEPEIDPQTAELAALEAIAQDLHATLTTIPRPHRRLRWMVPRRLGATRVRLITYNGYNAKNREGLMMPERLSWGWLSFVLLLLMFVALTFFLIPTNSQAAPLAHGTPDPNATPSETDPITFDEEITFYKHIQPIIEANCAACHIGEGIGASYFLYDSPEIIQNAAEDIAYLAGIGYMPPWMPSNQTRPMQHDRRLTDEEIAILQHWVEDGTPLGDPADYVPVESDIAPDVRQDMVLSIAEPYTPDDTLQDEYRCFKLELNLSEPTFMTGYEVLPDSTKMAHHAILYHLPARMDARALVRDNESEGQGWRCYGGAELPEDNTIGSWTPGMLPVVYPEGTGFLLEPGDFIVLQMHYNLVAGVEPDQTQIALQLAPASDSMTPLIVAEIPGPVEIPCPAGVEGEQCDRDYAIQVNEEKYDNDAREFADGMLERCGLTPDDFINQDAANVVSTCDVPIPFNVTAIEILPHMHEKGKSIQIILNPDTPDEQILMDIPRWDFHWQGTYQWVEPVEIQAGDVLRLTCVWDNTQSDNPRYIVWGEGTDDEMCLTFITVYPTNRR